VVRVVPGEVVPLRLPYALAGTRIPTEALPRARERQAQLRAGSGLCVAATCVCRSRPTTTRWSGQSRTVLGLPGRRHYRTPRCVAANYRSLAVEKLAALDFDTDKIRSDAWLG
jgi:hypothetical protein